MRWPCSSEFLLHLCSCYLCLFSNASSSIPSSSVASWIKSVAFLPENKPRDESNSPPHTDKLQLTCCSLFRPIVKHTHKHILHFFPLEINHENSSSPTSAEATKAFPNERSGPNHLQRSGGEGWIPSITAGLPQEPLKRFLWLREWCWSDRLHSW